MWNYILKLVLEVIYMNNDLKYLYIVYEEHIVFIKSKINCNKVNVLLFGAFRNINFII